MLGDGVEIVIGDFGDAGSLRTALDGVDGVFLACSNQPRQVEYETRVIDAAREAGVRRIVKLSALGAEIGISGGVLGLARKDRGAPAGVGGSFRHPAAYFFHGEPTRCCRDHRADRQ